MRKIKFQKNIDVDSLYELITSHIIHGFFYTVISRNNFSKVVAKDFSIAVADKRKEGLGYVWYSYNNYIYLVTDDLLEDNELIYLKEEDLPILMRQKKIQLLTRKIKK